MAIATVTPEEQERMRQGILSVARAMVSAATMDGTIPTMELLEQKADLAITVTFGRPVSPEIRSWVIGYLTEYRHEAGQHPAMSEPPKKHTSWLNEDGTYTDRSRGSPDWRQWKRYHHFLLEQQPKGLGRARQDVIELDRATNDTLRRMIEPTVEPPWSTYGMVVGNVQSGKTQHYTALMNKAADVGYRIIIVLAGTKNSLRWQTQLRIDKEFAGKHSETLDLVGVGEFNQEAGFTDASTPFPWTVSHITKGDFSSMTTRLRALLDLDTTKPVYLVIKKNLKSLENLYDHLNKQTVREKLKDRPLLLIDDECDEASVNTNYQGKDAKSELENRQATRINEGIRKILNLFPRFSYVGYTATPFANVFIPHDPETKYDRVDLYPQHYITVLDPPNNYVGASKIFGLEDEPTRRIKGQPALEIVREVKDYATREVDGQKIEGFDKYVENEKEFGDLKELPQSLQDAILGFLLATSAHKLRAGKTQYATMLIHVVSKRQAQSHLIKVVQEFTERVRQSVLFDPKSPFIARLEGLWQNEYLQTSAQLMDAGLAVRFPMPSLQDVVSDIKQNLDRLTPTLVNMDSKARLDYTKPPEETPIYLTVGANILSRGFTLEGLTTSYFLRQPDAADTLLQMGRWFGYRQDHIDLCRIHTLPAIKEGFQYIANSLEELRNTFRQMAKDNKPPSEFAYAVRMHPTGALRITAANKSKFTHPILGSLRGRDHRILTFNYNAKTLAANLSAAGGFLAKVAASGPPRKDGAIDYWTVPADLVLEFLASEYTISQHDKEYYLKDIMATYIQAKKEIQPEPELTHFTVGIHARPESAVRDAEVPGFGAIRLSVRDYKDKDGTPKNRLDDDRGFVRLNGLDSPEQFMVGLTDEQKERAKQDTKVTDLGAKTASREHALAARPKTLGLLLLYFVDTKKSFDSLGYKEPDQPLVSFMAAFPTTTVTNEKEYSYLARFARGAKLAQ